jgi:hypothetical protein
MAVAFRSSGDGVGQDNAASITLNTPAGVTATDVVLAVFVLGGGSNVTVTPPTGWTVANRINDGTKSSQIVYWALGNVASYTFTYTNVSDTMFGYTLAYSGVDNSTPMDATAVSQFTASGGTVMTAPTITTVTANAMLVAFHGWFDPFLLQSTTPTFSSETLTTNRHPTTYQWNGASLEAIDAEEGVQASTGASGAKTSTASLTFTSGFGTLVALRPSSGATQTPQDFEQHTLGRSFAIPYTLAARAAVFAPSLTPALATAVPANSKPRSTVLPDFFMRPPWNPERTWVARAGWTQALWAIPPTWKPEPSLPASFLRPKWDPERSAMKRPASIQSTWAIPPTWRPSPVLPEVRLTPWNPERSAMKRPASIQTTWAVPPTKIPEPVLADSFARPDWKPERTHSVGIPYLPPTWPTTVVAPERNPRPPWDPERSTQARAGWIQALWAIAPQKIPDPSLPERLLAPWRAPDQQPLWPPFQFNAPPTWGYELLGPQSFARFNWNPQRTDLTRAGWTQALWSIPPPAFGSATEATYISVLMMESGEYSAPFVQQIPVFGYEVHGPERSMLKWNPQRTELTRAGWIQSLWAVPPLNWKPLLPDQPYPLVAPDRSALCIPIVVAAVPRTTLYAIFMFDD